MTTPTESSASTAVSSTSPTALIPTRPITTKSKPTKAAQSKRPNFSDLLDCCQGNLYPSMSEDLGDHLGVTPASLCQLGVGWIATFPTKKGHNYGGAFVIPERDADAKVVGLGLRLQDDSKFCYPGSNHGCMFPVNEYHVSGARGFSPGPSNWVRIAEAGVCCPICGKADWCLVHHADPADPAAVICSRVAEGAEKQLKGGYLHIRRPEGQINRSASALAESDGDDPVLIVEGMSDAAAAMDMGFIAVGRPSNLACMDILRDLCRGRRVLILGENDDRTSAKTGALLRPGRDGMLAAFQTLKHVCKNPRMLMPPEQFKDLRAWKVKGGLTKAELLEYADKHAQSSCASDVIDNPLPDTIADAFLDANFKLRRHYTLRRWQEEWFRFEGSKYRKVTDEELYGPLQGWAKGKQVATGNDKKPLVPLEVKLRDLAENLIAKVNVPGADVPVWLDGATGPDPHDLILFPNGVLDVGAYFDGDPDAFSAPTPALFATNRVDFHFDPTVTCPVWLAFLESSLGDEREKILLLQEWMGYLLTPDTHFQKIMFMVGQRRSGKGTATYVLQQLVGMSNIAALTAKSLSGRFGLWPLVGKRLAVIPDARFAGGDNSGLAEHLLSISGEDALNIDRKGLPSLEAVKLQARLLLVSNESPAIADTSNALTSRFLVVEFNESFLDREDLDLRAKLLPELPGIFMWALEGLKRLRRQGRFTQPPKAAETIQYLERLASPVTAFVNDCCVIEPSITDKSEWTELDHLFAAWCWWCEKENRKPGTKEVFSKNLHTAFRKLASFRPHVGESRPSAYRGVTLNADGRNALMEFGSREERKKLGAVNIINIDQAALNNGQARHTRGRLSAVGAGRTE